jgi:putative DNA primase/helicase
MQHHHDIDRLRELLRERAAELGEALLGPPTWRSRAELRWGSRGSFALATAGPKRGLWHDHEAGEGGNLLDLVQRERGGGFAAASQWASAWLGEAGATTPAPRRETRQRQPEGQREACPKRDTAAIALDMWRGAAESIDGTPAEAYLLRRGIDPARLPAHTGVRWPAALRWHPGRSALIVAINDAATGLVRAAQLIALQPSGAPVLRDGRKLKLTYGPLRARAVRFGWRPSADGRWALAEGMETALAAATILRCPVWACLGAANMLHIEPPSWATSATVCADHDPPGLCAARETAERLARHLPVTVLAPEQYGCDAADLTREGAT